MATSRPARPRLAGPITAVDSPSHLAVKARPHSFGGRLGEVAATRGFARCPSAFRTPADTTTAVGGRLSCCAGLRLEGRCREGWSR
jgi:hypothetical protein